ncbi:Abhydrolase domain-containing protein [Ceratobasidium sp. AG-Ba]|nr:Abhydrolase domain-containing protein [Ceratobasidium sp. AG-Ba]
MYNPKPHTLTDAFLIAVDIASALAALAMLAPQLTAALQPPASSNEADESSTDRLSDSNRRTNMKFKYNERPSGTAGRGDFDLRNRMGLNKLDYDLFLRTVKDATHVAQLDRTQMMKFQDARRLACARSKIIKALPGLSVYANCKWPYWPVDGGLLISLKASAQAHKRRQEQLALAENPPANLGDDPADDGHDPVNADNHANADNPANVEGDRVLDAAPAGDVEDDSNADEIGDRTMASVHEFDEIPDAEVDMEEEESQDEQEEEEVMDDMPPSAPPAYNSAPAPIHIDTDSDLAPSTTRKAGSRKTSPVSPVLAANMPAAKDRAQSLTPTDPDPLGSTTTTTRSRRNNNKAAGSVSISPSSNIVLTSTTGAAPATSTISYAATTTTTVQAQASSTTGALHELGNPAGYAWLPVSKRPPAPSVQDPFLPNPADSTTKPKRGKKTATAAPLANVDAPTAPAEPVQPKPKPKGRTAKAGAAVPAPDPEVSEVEPAPVAKATRKRIGAGASANKSANAKPASGSRPRSKAEGIARKTCDTTGLIECGRFEVPLDYKNLTASKASLAVARYAATKEPKLGTLFLNTGGPGESGVEMILGGAKEISESVGGQYDLVSWDPRGVGLTHPRAECFASAANESAFWENTIPHTGLEARGNFTDQADLDSFYAQVPEVDALLIELGQRCLAYSPDTFQYVGTVVAVRDMIALHDYLEDPKKPVNYWGISYGTAIGSYFVNMYPDRVGRVVIDGVVDPFWAVSVESTDEALTGFVEACAYAGPGNCALASKNSTADSLRKDLLKLVDLAYEYRKLYPDSEYSSSYIRGKLLNGMYTPKQWPQLAETLLETYLAVTSSSSSNAKRSSIPKTSLSPVRRDLLLRQQGGPNQSEPAPSYAFQAVTCADAIDTGNVTTKMVWDELVRVTRAVSPLFGPIWGDAGFYCHRWPVRAVERYTGPWNKVLSNPILVVGERSPSNWNEADPITPFISAKNVADALGDSAILVEQDDYGHGSMAMHSSCTISIIRNYFTNNTLPTQDQFCETNQVLFPGQGITRSTLKAFASSTGSGSNSTNLTGSPDPLQSKLDDAETTAKGLLIAVIALACATSLLFLGLIGSCVWSRKQKAKTRGTNVFFPSDDRHEQGHVYATPYEGGKKEKDGYAPVQT